MTPRVWQILREYNITSLYLSRAPVMYHKPRVVGDELALKGGPTTEICAHYILPGVNMALTAHALGLFEPLPPVWTAPSSPAAPHYTGLKRAWKRCSLPDGWWTLNDHLAIRGPLPPGAIPYDRPVNMAAIVAREFDNRPPCPPLRPETHDGYYYLHGGWVNAEYIDFVLSNLRVAPVFRLSEKKHIAGIYADGRLVAVIAGARIGHGPEPAPEPHRIPRPNKKGVLPWISGEK